MSAERSEHWSELPERGDISGLWVMYATYAVLGRRIFSLLLYPVAAYFCVTARSARRASRDYLARVRRRMQELGRPVPPRLSTFGHFVEFGHSVLDRNVVWAGRLPPSSIELADPKLFRRLRDSSRGALFIGSHLGNVEVLRAHAQTRQGLPITALVSTRNSPKLNSLLSAVGPRSAERLMEIDSLGPESIVELQDRIHAGEHVAVAADRVSVRHRERSICVPFLGAPAPFPEGPFVLASLLACPVYLIFCVRVRGRYRVHIEPFADPLVLPRQGRQEALERTIARYALELESHCLLAPTQWFNFFDFWRQADAQRAPDRAR